MAVKSLRIISIFSAAFVCGCIISACSSDKFPAESASHDKSPVESASHDKSPVESASYTPERELSSFNLPEDEKAEQAEDEATKADTDKESKIAYITIDDGPSRENTPVILDILKKEDIKATFFVLPHSNVDDIYLRIIDEGHEIGNHSYSHDYAALYQSDNIDCFNKDVQKMQEYLISNFGYQATSFRFPGGTMGIKTETIREREAVLSEMGYRYFDWHVSTCDTDTGPQGKIVDTLVNNVIDNTMGREKLIILMHDSPDKKTTVEALPIIIAKLKDQGYTFDILKNY